MSGKGRKKIGILGGTFDPIHIGHLQMALCAFSQFGLDEVRVMPNGSPPHKNDRLITAKPSERLEMARLAICDARTKMGGKCPLNLLDYEIRRRKTSYSYETMEHFTALEPDTEFYFIVGGDSLMQLDTWMKPERLLKTCVILAAVRGEDDNSHLEKRFEEYAHIFPGCDIRLLEMPQIDVSSTDIRARLLRGEKITGLVTPSVEEYISEHPFIYDGSRLKLKDSK